MHKPFDENEIEVYEVDNLTKAIGVLFCFMFVVGILIANHYGLTIQ